MKTIAFISFFILSSVIMTSCFAIANNLHLNLDTTLLHSLSDTSVLVTDVYNDGERSSGQSENYVYMGNIIVVKVRNLSKLLRQSDRDPQLHVPKNLNDIRLFIDGSEIKEQPIEYGEAKEVTAIKFLLKPDLENETWETLLDHPNYLNGLLLVNCEVSVGLRGKNQPSIAKNCHLVVTTRSWLITATILIIFYMGGVAIILKKTNIIKYKSFVEVNTANGGIKDNYIYSLAKFQLFFWIALIMACYIYLFIVLDETDLFPFALMSTIGISTLTLFFAALINKKNNKKIVIKNENLEKRASYLKETISLLKKKIHSKSASDNNEILEALIDDKIKLLLVQEKLDANLGKLNVSPSKGFFSDILMDGGFLSFQRLVMFITTIVMAIIFLKSVLIQFKMPEIDDKFLELVGLQGLSSGAYLSSKSTG